MTKKKTDKALEEVIRVGKLRNAIRDEMREIAKEEIQKALNNTPTDTSDKYAEFKKSSGFRGMCNKCGKPKMRTGSQGAGVWNLTLMREAGDICNCKS